MNLDRIFRLLVPAGLLLIAAGGQALAHKVNVFAYAEGDSVYTESYFNDGKKCRNSAIAVYDGSDKPLLEGKTDDEGLFAFPIPKREALRIVLTVSMGHRAECVLSRAELTGAGAEEEAPPAQVSAGGGSAPDEDIDRALARRLSPLVQAVRRLEEQQERASLRDILGGVGYIAGLAGLYYYFRSRSR